MRIEEAINYLKNSMAINEDEGSRYHNEVLEFTIKALEQEPCEDCIDRQRAIRRVKEMCNPYGKPTIDFESGKKVIKLLERMSSVTVLPAQKFETVTEFAERCRECGTRYGKLLKEKNDFLDKIRAEIRALSPEPTAFDVVDGNPVKDAVWETIAEVLQIINKYKAESEE